ncbi:MAG: hypothetical protein ACTHOG_12805 [Marmoricola sp.]|jgi:hypothetical protein
MDELAPTPIPLKAKYTCSKTRGSHKGGERPGGKKRKHTKNGKKSYVYGSRVMYVGPTGKISMGAPRPE